MLVRAAYAKVLGPRAIALPARAAGAAHESDALMHERSDSAGVGRRVSTRAASSRLEPAAQDVVVVGGGIVGCATAFFLKQRDPSISVKVVERDSSVSRTHGHVGSAWLVQATSDFRQRC